jgi:type VI secretion system protein ImpJ
MFLRPQHLQASHRFESEQRGRGDKWDLHYSWGLRSVEINEDALKNHRLEIPSLRARLRDGTLVSIPEDGALPSMDLKKPLGSERAVKVWLAVPSLRLSRANIAEPEQNDGGRYLLEPQDLEDENTGLNPQRLEMRRLNIRLILDNQEDHPGYETLPIARIEKSGEAEVLPKIDELFIPPLLGCEGWKPLHTLIIRYIYDLVGVNKDTLADQVLDRGIGVESSAAEDAVIINWLRCLNESWTLLDVLAFAEGVHPLPMYTELCRMVGQFAIFHPERRPHKLPNYDHDDLGKCFWAVKKELDLLLALLPKSTWIKRPFVYDPLRMQVEIKQEWLQPAWQMYVGVQSSLPPEECLRLLTTPGQLDMKIGSRNRVESIFRAGQKGLHFIAQRTPPRALPATQGLVYLEVDRAAQPAEWQAVRDEGFVALRMNERKFERANPGEDTLTIKERGQNVVLKFALYLLRGDVSGSRPPSPPSTIRP